MTNRLSQSIITAFSDADRCLVSSELPNLSLNFCTVHDDWNAPHRFSIQCLLPTAATAAMLAL